MRLRTAAHRMAAVGVAALALLASAGASPAAAAEAGWFMSNGRSYLCIRPAGGSSATNVAIEQVTCNPDASSQWWFFVPTSDGYYRLRNAYSGKCMNVRGGVSNTSAPIIQYPCGTTGLNDQFRPRLRYHEGSDYYNLIARHSGKCINVPRNSTVSGTDLIQYPCTTTERNDTFTWVDVVIGP
jgi:endoglucanase